MVGPQDPVWAVVVEEVSLWGVSVGEAGAGVKVGAEAVVAGVCASLVVAEVVATGW